MCALREDNCDETNFMTIYQYQTDLLPLMEDMKCLNG